LRIAFPASYQTTSGRSVALTREAWNVGANPGLSYQLSRLDALDLDLGETYSDTGVSIYVQTQIFLGWAHTISRRWTSNLGGGVARVDQPGTQPLRPASHFGLAQAGITHRESSGSESASLGLTAQVDPVLGEVRPRATSSLSANQNLPSRFTLSESVAASSVVAARPLPTDPNETSLSTGVGVGWRVTRILTLRWGVRAAWAGPHWSSGFEPRQRTLLGFVGLSAFYPPD
jgi:hypothetical protein